MGKTALSLQVAHHIAAPGTPALVLSMEMPATELAAREVARVAKLSVADMAMRGKIRDEDWAALTGWSEYREAICRCWWTSRAACPVEPPPRSAGPAASTASAWRFWTTAN